MSTYQHSNVKNENTSMILSEKSSKEINDSIECIRQWLLKQSHIKSRVDDKFIVSFLHAAKFDHKKAKIMIENFWLTRTQFSEIFQERVFTNGSRLMHIASLGLLIPLVELDPNGNRVVIQRPGKWDTKMFDFEDMVKYLFSCMDIICEETNSQINGVKCWLDDLRNIKFYNKIPKIKSSAHSHLSML